MITPMVTDEKKIFAVETIIKTNQPDNGDGKVFVIDSSDSVHIRTGEKGTKHLINRGGQTMEKNILNIDLSSAKEELIEIYPKKVAKKAQ